MLEDPKHPIWPLLRITVGVVGLLFFLWMFSSKFDITEIKTFGSFLMWMIGGEAVAKLIYRKRGDSDG